MINVNDIAYAVMMDGSVINNFGDADENNVNASISDAIKPICYAPYNILKAIMDKKGSSNKELCLVFLGMLKHDYVSRKVLNEYLLGLINLDKKAQEK